MIKKNRLKLDTEYYSVNSTQQRVVLDTQCVCHTHKSNKEKGQFMNNFKQKKNESL